MSSQEYSSPGEFPDPINNEQLSGIYSYLREQERALNYADEEFDKDQAYLDLLLRIVNRCQLPLPDLYKNYYATDKVTLDMFYEELRNDELNEGEYTKLLALSNLIYAMSFVDEYVLSSDNKVEGINALMQEFAFIDSYEQSVGQVLSSDRISLDDKLKFIKVVEAYFSQIDLALNVGSELDDATIKKIGLEIMDRHKDEREAIDLANITASRIANAIRPILKLKLNSMIGVYDDADEAVAHLIMTAVRIYEGKPFEFVSPSLELAGLSKRQIKALGDYATRLYWQMLSADYQ